MYEALKQGGIYTDLLKDGTWISPKTEISEALSGQILKTAKLFAGENSIAMTTFPELELWIKHLKPVWKKELKLMKEALANCYREAEQLGVLSGDTSAEEIIKFL